MTGNTAHVKYTPGSHLIGNIIELGGIKVPFDIIFKDDFSDPALCPDGEYYTYRGCELVDLVVPQ